MSTPFVGLKRVIQQTQQDEMTPWMRAKASSNVDLASQGLPLGPMNEASLVKQRLVELLSQHFGIESLQVGAFVQALSPQVPVKDLMDATRDFVTRYAEEGGSAPPELAQVIACLQALETQR